MKQKRLIRAIMLVMMMALMMALMLACSSSNDTQQVYEDTPPPPPPENMRSGDSDSGGSESTGVMTDGIQVSIAPEHPALTDTIRARFSGIDREKVRINWRVNGTDLSTYDPMAFSPAQNNLLKGDRVQAILVYNDAEFPSNEVIIENTPPHLTQIRIMPQVFRPGDTIYVDAQAEDPDREAVTLQYAWTVNGLPAGSDATLPQVVRGGDKFTVTVTPYDSSGPGVSSTLSREVGNAPPMLEQHYRYTFSNSQYSYQTRATDPEGETLNYSLERAPEGMTIDPYTGRVDWTVPYDFTGTAVYVIVVTDPKGASSRMEMRFTLSTE